MGEYITKKTDEDKKEFKWIAKKDKEDKKEYITKKKKPVYIKKKVKQADLTEHRADIEKAVSEGVGYIKKKKKPIKWITIKEKQEPLPEKRKSDFAGGGAVKGNRGMGVALRGGGRAFLKGGKV